MMNHSMLYAATQLFLQLLYSLFFSIGLIRWELYTYLPRIFKEKPEFYLKTCGLCNNKRYVNEFSGRHNDRPPDTIEQMRDVVENLDGKHLPSKRIRNAKDN